MSTADKTHCELSAVAAIAAIRSGDLSAESYAASLLSRVDQLRELNAFRTLDHARMMAAASAADSHRRAGRPLGRLHGLPIPVKDSVNTRFLPTSNGTRALEHFQPREDAAVLEALFAQGAFLMGKTNLHELSLGWTSNNLTFGPIKNPYDPTRIPGGSSGGSAVAVAARMAPLAVAEDTLGSVRVPAALCGLAGLRPTFGRYPGTGVLSISLDKFDQVGPLARVVEDLVLFDSIVTNDFAELPPVSIAGTRIGIAPRYFFDGLDGEVERVVALAIDRLKFEGVVIVEAEIPEVIAQCLDVALAIQWHEFHGSFAKFLREHQTGISLEQLFSQVAANTASDLEPGAPFPDPEGHYQNALQSRELIKKSYQRHFADNRIDALLFPPVLCPAPPLGDNRMIEIAGRPVPIRTVFGRNMAVGPCTGAPGLVLPAGLASNGLPVGIELEALPGRDRALLSLGLGVEKLLGPIPPPTACS